jgi:hypothetical protein
MNKYFGVNKADLLQEVKQEFEADKDDEYYLNLINELLEVYKEYYKVKDTEFLVDTFIYVINESINKIDDKAKLKPVLDTMFRLFVTSKDKDMRAGVSLTLVNGLFKVYFKLNALKLSQMLIKTIKQLTTIFPPIESFPLNQQVLYKYYIAKNAMYEGDFKVALNNLSFVFNNSTNNKKIVLQYLVPLKLLHGYSIDVAILRKYELNRLEAIQNAIRTGNVKELTKIIELEEMDYFINKGLFLLMQKLKIIAYRNLFRIMTSLYQKDNENGYKIHLKVYKNVYNQYKDNIPSLQNSLPKDEFRSEEVIIYDQMKCTLTNLINKGMVRGYISYTNNIIVLSKKEPFPKLSTIL